MKSLICVLVAAVSFCRADSHFEMMIPPQEIAERVQAAALQIDQDYEGEELAILIVMKGAICLGADLIRHLHIPLTLDYVSASSYGKKGDERGECVVQGLENLDLVGKHVLLVDDIFDSGQTIMTLIKALSKYNLKSLKTLVLLEKNVSRTTDYVPDYSLFHIDHHFVVGYGLDYKELYRGLPGIYRIVQDSDAIKK